MESTTRNGTQQPVLEHVHPALLLPPLHDLRDRTTPDYLDYFHNRFVPDLRQRGKLVPIIGYRERDRIRVEDGETSRQGSLVAGLETVPVLVYETKPDKKQALLGSWLANSMRRDNTPQEAATAYQKLMAEFGWTQAALAKALHVSPANVAKVLAISTKLCDQVQALVASGDLSPRAAYALTRLADHQQQAELARKAVDLPMAVESVEEAVNKLLGNGRRVKAKPLKLKFDGVQMVASNPTLDGVQAFAERLLAAVKRLVKEGDGIEWLPSRINAS